MVLALAHFNEPVLTLADLRYPAGIDGVAGCDCGGLEWHRLTCSIYQLGQDEAMAAIADAQARVRVYIDRLNVGLNSRCPWPRRPGRSEGPVLRHPDDEFGDWLHRMFVVEDGTAYSEADMRAAFSGGFRYCLETLTGKPWRG